MPQSLSVCTLVRNRTDHLKNVLAGLTRQHTPPDDVVIVWMQDAPDPINGFDLPLQEATVPSKGLPLARARNTAAHLARSEVLVFLDVDCLPAPQLCTAYAEALRDAPNACIMGATRYLTANAAVADEPFETLWQGAVQHPARIDPDVTRDTTRPIDDCAEFWSLSFAMARHTFMQVGGFDERFVGYGGEDTDFAMRLRLHGVPLIWSGNARAVHQWHRISSPPVQHFDDIITNARLFHGLHGSWPMTYWLDQFEDRGWIDRSGSDLTVISRPGPSDIEAALQPDHVAFS